MLLETEGLVVRADRSGEADRLLTLFSLRHGKLLALAQSADKAGSRWGGCTGLFAHLEAILYAKREESGRFRLTQCRVIRGYEGIRGSIRQIAAASQVCALVADLAFERQPIPGLWDLLTDALERIETGEGVETMAVAFTAQLAAILGVAPHLAGCTQCGKVYPVGRDAYYSPPVGGMVCRECRPNVGEALLVSGEAIGFLSRVLQEGFEGVPGGGLQEKAVDEVRRVLTSHLEYHLEYKPQVFDWKSGLENPL